MDVTISELKGAEESETAMLLWKLYERLESIGPQARQRVYARWEHVKLTLPGDGKRWEKELRRVTGR